MPPHRGVSSTEAGVQTRRLCALPACARLHVRAYWPVEQLAGVAAAARRPPCRPRPCPKMRHKSNYLCHLGWIELRCTTPCARWAGRPTRRRARRGGSVCARRVRAGGRAFRVRRDVRARACCVAFYRGAREEKAAKTGRGKATRGVVHKIKFRVYRHRHSSRSRTKALHTAGRICFAL